MNVNSLKLNQVSVIPENLMARTYANISISFKLNTFLPFNSILSVIFRGGRNNKNDWFYLQPFDKSQKGFIKLSIDPSGKIIPLQITGKELIVKYIVCEENGIKEGTHFKIHIYNTLVQSLAEKGKKFNILIKKPDDTLIVVENPPQIDIVHRRFDHITIICPSILRIDENFKILIRIEDDKYNLVEDFSDTLKLTLSKYPDPFKILKIIEFTQKNKGIKSESDFFFPEPGIYFLEAVYENQHFQSNPIKCVEKEYRNKLYWGYIHGHTNKSDGLSDPESYFNNVINAGLNFGATTEHDHIWETSDDDFEDIKNIEERFNSEQFVTIFGYEWGYWYTGYGDICVYYLDPNLPILRSDTNKFNSTEKLSKNLLAFEDKVLLIPHHTALRPGYRNWDHFNNSIERLVEIYSTWGNQEFPSYEGNPLPPRYKFFGYGPFAPKKGPIIEKRGSFIKDALNRGYKLGFTAGGDDHFGLYPSGPFNPENGIYPSGILAVWTTHLTRESLWDALLHRKCYGTTGPRVIVEFNINNFYMGDIIDSEMNPTILKHRIINLKLISPLYIEKVDIIRNNKIYASQVVNSKIFETQYNDLVPFQEISQLHQNKKEDFLFYYPRIYIANSNMAWASPIWITKKK